MPFFHDLSSVHTPIGPYFVDHYRGIQIIYIYINIYMYICICYYVYIYIYMIYYLYINILGMDYHHIPFSPGTSRSSATGSTSVRRASQMGKMGHKVKPRTIHPQNF